ncbi:MAG: MucBP domain-containing protein, partial [Oenococcus sp.]|uniref:lectin-like domain-containing protein n=1 Tax=Oenococcus sp. TaxID=1979414 RepID=UPI0039EC43E1
MKKNKEGYRTSDNVTRFKLYKSGKEWVVSGLTWFTTKLIHSLSAVRPVIKEDDYIEEPHRNFNLLKGVSALAALFGGSALVSGTQVSADSVQQSTQKATEQTTTAKTLATADKATIPAASQTSSSTSQSTSLSTSESASTSLSTSESLASSEGASSSESASASENVSNSESTASSSTATSTPASASASTASQSASNTASTSQQVSTSTSSSNTSSSTSGSTSSTGNSQMSSPNTSKTVQVSYKTLLAYTNLDAVAQTHVTPQNFLDYFTLNGSAINNYDPNTGIVTITPDANDKVGNFSLKSKIDMNTSFTLTGQVNLGSNPNGADGIGFAFHNGNTDDLGNAGGNLGIGGLQDAIGFKLDTWNNSYQAPQSSQGGDVNGAQIDPTNSNGFGWNGDSMKAPYGTFVTTSDQQIKAVDGTEVERWWAQDVSNEAQALSKNDVDGQFHNFTVTYDGTTRQLTINYTQTSGKILTWTYSVPNSDEAMSMIVSASTGGAKNQQQFKITSFDFQQAATVNVLYVDTSGHQIAQGTVAYPNGASVNGSYTTTQLDIPGYSFLCMSDSDVTGGKSLPATGILTQEGHNGNVIYVYSNNASTSASM